VRNKVGQQIASVKPVELRFQTSAVRDALSELSENCDDPTTKCEILVTHELETFELPIGLVIWY